MTVEVNRSRPFWENPGMLLAVLVGVSLIRLLVAASHPLFETECYYWMYGANLDFGYFDHPPLLGIIQSLFDFWAPPSSLAARCHSVVEHFFTSIFLYWYARNLFQSTVAGIRTALLFNVIPIYSIMAIQNQPDAPLLFFWAATLLCFERSLATGKAGWWLLAGVAAGGALLSKYHAIPLAGSLVLHLVFFPKDRRHWTSPWPYLAGALAVAIYTPNFWWNAQNDWITYNFQLFDHAADGEFRLIHLLGVLFAPLLLLSPWIYGHLAQTIPHAFKPRALAQDRTMSLIFWSSMPLFCLFLFVSLNKSVKIHWTAPAFIGLLPLIAVGLEKWSFARRTSFYSSAGVMTSLTYLYLVSPYPVSLSVPDWRVLSVINDKTSKYVETDWSAQIYGFAELGAYLKSKIEDDRSEKFDLIASTRFDRASISAFYAGHPERAFVPAYGDRRGYTLWASPYAKPGANTLYVCLEQKSAARREREVRRMREDYEAVGDPFRIETNLKGRPHRRFLVYPCFGLKKEALDHLVQPAHSKQLAKQMIRVPGKPPNW